MQKSSIKWPAMYIPMRPANIERVLGNVAFQIPHSEEVKAQVLEGNLLKELVLKDSKGFRKNMEAITKEVFGC